jgi:hypothetical protein
MPGPATAMVRSRSSPLLVGEESGVSRFLLLV